MGTRKSAGKFKESRLAAHVANLWSAMSATGSGYKRHSLRHTGRGDDRRNDKMREVAYVDADGKQGIKYKPFMFDESKLQRAARLQSIGLCHR